MLTHAHTNYPPVVPGCIIFSITHFTKDFDRKHFPSLTVAIKTTLQLRNKLPFLLSSRGYLSHIVWRAFRLLATHGQTFVACKVLGSIKARCTNKTQLVSDTLFTWPHVCYVGILNNKTGAILVSQTCIVGVQLFSYVIASFVSENLHSCRPR